MTHLLQKELCALVLYVSLGGGQQGAHRIHSDAALRTVSVTVNQPAHLYKARAGVFELVQSVVVGSVHHAQQRARLQRDATRVDVP